MFAQRVRPLCHLANIDSDNRAPFAVASRLSDYALTIFGEALPFISGDQCSSANSTGLLNIHAGSVLGLITSSRIGIYICFWGVCKKVWAAFRVTDLNRSLTLNFRHASPRADACEDPRNKTE